jgi:hypothetical protein
MSAKKAPKARTIKWKKIVGDEHTASNWSVGEDLGQVEIYLNEMIAQGWRPVRVSWGTSFTFVPCTPGECICRSAMTVTKSGFYDKNRAAQLSDLLLTSGACLVEQTATMGNRVGLIAVRSTQLGPFEIYSDLDSRIAEHRARERYYEGKGVRWFVLAMMWFVLAMMWFVIGQTSTGGPLAFVAAAGFFIAALFHITSVARYRKSIKALEVERGVTES